MAFLRHSCGILVLSKRISLHFEQLAYWPITSKQDSLETKLQVASTVALDIVTEFDDILLSTCMLAVKTCFSELTVCHEYVLSPISRYYKHAKSF
jgi:membrane-bound acyltransferase YfiQ involved in biofilm formation